MFMPLENRSQILKRDKPEIDGSFGGFIALVVCLAIIVIVASSAIYYLLRYYEPSDAERASRRQRHYQQRGSPLSSWFSKLRSLSIFNKSKGSGQGWMQANSGDEWDSDIADEGTAQRQLSQVNQPRDAPFRPPISILHPSQSSSSVRFDTQGTPTKPTGSLSAVDEAPVVRASSPEPMSEEVEGLSVDNDGRSLSYASASSARTFSGGTKFLEGL